MEFSYVHKLVCGVKKFITIGLCVIPCGEGFYDLVVVGRVGRHDKRVADCYGEL